AAVPETGHFRRRDRLSPLAQDVNDPEARSREHDFRAGYEWRLGEATQTQDFLTLFNLHFYPLTLETVVLETGNLQRVEIVGRLQLPIAEGRELTELSNAVQLTFTAGATATDGLTLTAIALVSQQGEWPLALKDGEASDAPLLTWQGVQLTATGDGLELQSPQLKFVLFDHIWTVPLTTLHPTTAPDANPAWIFTTTGLPQTKVYAIPASEAAYLQPDSLSLTLDPVERQHRAHLDLQVQLGNLPSSRGRMALGERITFAAQVRFPLLSPSGDPTPSWVSGTLFEALTLNRVPLDTASPLVTSNTALQFRWHHAPVSDLQLLPGMPLRSLPDQPETETPGFAALTFELQPVANGVPILTLTSAFLETLLFCQWGQFLQTDAVQTNAATLAEGQAGQLDQVFGSSAGDLVCAYTTTWQAIDDTWPETLLLNGVLEIKNLISWPQSLSVQTVDDRTQLQLPRLPAASGLRSLPHLRHSLRILLNQHQFPTDLLTVARGNLLFQLQPDALWHFLAVVEHQLIAVDFSGEGDALQIQLQRDRRWSVTQEVRWIAPDQFKATLDHWAAIASPDPTAGTAQRGSGYFDPMLNQTLAAEVEALRQQPMMFIEASTHQWLNQDPLTTLSPATLQFLPNGSQLGILSSPDNYHPSDPTDPRWLLLTLPFLGRLQAVETVSLTEMAASRLPETISPLQLDPVLSLAQVTAPAPLALMLATWQPTSPHQETVVSVPLAGINTAAGRTWARLDPLSLEESWFRLQNPVSEITPTQFQSVMATLQDSPARLSRARSLNQNFDSFRRTIPPSTRAGYDLLLVPPGQDLPTTGQGLVAVAKRNDDIYQARTFDHTGTPVVDRVIRRENGQFPVAFESLRPQLDRMLAAIASGQSGIPQTTSEFVQQVAASVSYPEPVTEVVWQPQSLLKTQGLSHPEGLQVLYQFQGGSGNRVADISGVGEPLDLDILDLSGRDRGSDPIAWQWEADGLRLVRPAILISQRSATQLVRACQATNELTVEAWIEPTYEIGYPRGRGPFPIVSLDRTLNTNFCLEQGPPRPQPDRPNFYIARVRTSTTKKKGTKYRDSDRIGEPFTKTAEGTIASRLSHVVYTRNGQGETQFYLNGELLETRAVPGDFTPWEDDMFLALGNEVSPDFEAGELPSEGQKPWFGKYYRVAIYNQALTAAQVSQNFTQGYTGLLRATPYPWSNTGAQLVTSRLTQEESIPQEAALAVSRYAAATVLPISPQTPLANVRPQSFALSPYLGLAFQPAGLNYTRQLVSAELLCLDPATRSLRPIASHLWEDLKDLADPYTWAKETHLRLCPESPLAVLRFREVRQLADTPPPDATAAPVAPVITAYAYGIVSDLQLSELPLKRVFQLRSQVAQLRFQEGHFGGSQLPPLPGDPTQPDPLRLFELAPPQTIGSQPLYLTQHPQEAQKWPWGLSALRVSVQNTGRTTLLSPEPVDMPQTTASKSGVVGPISNDSQARTLWWQAAQSTVQYRPATASARPAAGLPAQFRAPAMSSLLPIALQPPLPVIDSTALFDLQQPEPVDRWQAVLPGTMRYLMVGDRPGVFFNLRNQLLRQSGLGTDEPTVGSVFVSGSVPVQHRMPRPVPLPVNQLPEQALQPWASYFEPTRNAVVTDAPADEAFFDADPTTQPATPAKRLTMQLLSPARGAITENWDGQLTFQIGGSIVTSLSQEWQVEVKAITSGTTIAYTATEPDGVYEPIDGNRREQLRRLLEQLPAGAMLMIQAEIQPATATDNFSQTLSFPLRMTDSVALPLPLQPQFIHFEDPDYNRQLASPTAYKSTQVQVPNPDDPNQPKLVGVRLSSDRREYNPDSLLSLRYDWEDPTAATEFEQVSLSVTRIRAGVETDLTVPLLRARFKNLPPAALTQFALTDLTRLQGTRERLQADDTVQLTLSLYRQANAKDPDKQVILPVQIVAAPVQPTPEAAYGLLRRNPDGAVECVRFAWSVMPNRVDMVNASDLKTEVVRRRAVFQWTDTKRMGNDTTYRVQKITQTGSTAFFDDL
ncbi:MAG: LamG domain-containing protein, partial [Leptolyngbya sp. SIO1D8]|nr:LamG domain-containing protein [Leptolyngbya sp. SIO1D8]